MTESNGEISINFINPLAGGSSGVVRLAVRFAPGTMPGTEYINRAQMVASNAITVTDDAPIVLADGTFKMFARKDQVTEDVVPGFPAVFNLNVCSPSDIGGVAFYDPLFVDRLPAEATFTGAQGVEGVDWDYDPVEHAVTYYITPNPVPVGACVTRQITMTFDAIPADPIQENRLEVTGLPDGCQLDPAQDYCDPDNPLARHVLADSNLFEVVAPFGGWGISKDARSNSDFIDSEALRGEQITYDINARNGGYLPLGNVVITDVIPSEVIFDQVTFAPQPLAATITAYYLLPGDPTPIPFPAPGPTYNTTATVTLADLGLAQGTEIEAIRWEVDGEIPPQSPNWRAVMLATVRGMDPIPTPPYFQNCVEISGVFTDTEATPVALIPYASSDCAFTEIVDRRSIPRIEKARTTAALAYPEDTVGYEMRVFNSPRRI